MNNYPVTMSLLQGMLPGLSEAEISAFIALAVTEVGKGSPDTLVEDATGPQLRSVTLGTIRRHALQEDATRRGWPLPGPNQGPQGPWR